MKTFITSRPFVWYSTVLVPVKPRTLDLWRTRQTADLIMEAREINETLRAIAVLNEADHAGQDNQDTLDALAEIPTYEIAPVILTSQRPRPNFMGGAAWPIRAGI